jgi:peptidoglycan L-alanyl-D-glutamate endopeptidase CwlK
MKNSRLIGDLDPEARAVCTAHLASCHLIGIELIVTSTWRDADAQTALFAIGRTVETERRAVTNAKAWRSWHQYKCAYDVVPVVSGKPVWDERDPAWKEVVRLGKLAGAEAGADWPTFKDLPHFQVRPAASGKLIELAEAQVRFQSSGTIFA